MASKAKTVQVKDKEKDEKVTEAPEKDSPDAPSPLLDLSDAAVKKMIKQAKKRGFVTFDQLNEVLPSDTTSPEQIEDIVSYINENMSIVGAPHVAPEHLPVFACSMGDNTIHYLGHVRMMGAVQPFISGALSKCVVGDTLLATADGLLRCRNRTDALA